TFAAKADCESLTSGPATVFSERKLGKHSISRVRRRDCRGISKKRYSISAKQYLAPSKKVDRAGYNQTTISGINGNTNFLASVNMDDKIVDSALPPVTSQQISLLNENSSAETPAMQGNLHSAEHRLSSIGPPSSWKPPERDSLNASRKPSYPSYL